MEKLAQEDHSYRLSHEDCLTYQKHWYFTLNKSGKNAPMRPRSDFRAAVTEMNRLHRESVKNVQNQSLFGSTKGGALLLPVLHGGIGIKTGGAHKNFFFFFQNWCSRFVYN